MKLHILRNFTPEQALFLLTRKHDTVRYWFNAYGRLCGVWTGCTGRTYAIGQNNKGETIAYVAAS